MKPMYCQYCGLPLTENCDCERVTEENHKRFLEDYENNPEVQHGWHQQDIIDMRRREQ